MPKTEAEEAEAEEAEATIKDLIARLQEAEAAAEAGEWRIAMLAIHYVRENIAEATSDIMAEGYLSVMRRRKEVR